MRRSLAVACPLAAVLVAMSMESLAGQQLGRPAPQSPPPAGQRLVARDGDTVVIEDEARVKIVRRREANIRLVYNKAEHWLIVLADFVVPNGPDGSVDMNYSFNDVTGEWPFDERWEGAAAIEEYANPGEMGSQGFGLALPQGVVQLMTQPRPARPGEAWPQDPNVTAVLTSNGSGRGTSRGSFDAAERRAVESVRSAAQRLSMPSGFSTSMGMSVSGASGGIVTIAPGEPAPVRVGGTIRQPTKLVDVKPVYPDAARQAGISGVVILEIVIDTDGSVKQARVLRSIPLLDASAIETVKQWRFEPTHLNGNPVPVIMTVTVNFNQ